MTDAITREEKLLAGIADGNGGGIEPITRQELFLAKLAGQNVQTPEPITRREKLLQEIIDNGGGGSGDTNGGDSQLDALIDGSITEITSNAKRITNTMFRNNTTLSTIDFPLLETIASNEFYGCTAIKTVNLPHVTSIGSNAFNKCTEWLETTLPLLTSVGNSALQGSGLTTVDLPIATSIGNYAFNATNLITLILRSESICVLQIANAFTSTPVANGTGRIYVPRALVDSYKSATNWSTYAAQFRALEDYTVDGTITGELDESKI